MSQKTENQFRRSSREHSRRSFLAATVGCGSTLTAFRFASPRAYAETRSNPEQALHRLMEGNQRFVNHRGTSCNTDLAARIKSTSESQSPFAAVLSCADSRVPVELIFDQTIGDIFVTRLAGNVATPEIIASLEFATAVLKAQVLLVLGHSGCGAVKAAIDAKEVPGQISALFQHIRPAVERAGTNLEAVTKANAQVQAGLLRESSPLIGGFVRRGEVKLVAGYYALNNGSVALLS